MPFSIDDLHTHVGFSVRHMMVSTVRGQFKQYRGAVDLDPNDFTKSRFEGEIDVTSIDTGNTQRDDHLRASDFLDVPTYPRITFKSSRIDRKHDNAFVVHGDLEIRGVTKPVAFDVEFHGLSKNPWGKMVAGLSATATIRRKDFGMSYNALLETGGVAVGDNVKIELDAEFVAA